MHCTYVVSRGEPILAGLRKVDMTRRSRLLLVPALAATILYVAAPFACAQTEDPFAIRVESNLVLVHTQVYDQGRMHDISTDDLECNEANDIVFRQLRPSEPFLPKECLAAAIHGLAAKDFRVFEDGIEQKIESVKVEPMAGIAVRDNFGVHGERSRTPRSKWSSTDFHVGDVRGTRGYFYQIAYVPSKPEEGKCHHVKVMVDRPHVAVFAKDQYCYTEHPGGDPLNGSKFGKQLETDLDSEKRGEIPLSLQASVFYTDARKARVEIALEFPWKDLKHQWKGLDLQATIGALGVVYNKDRTLAARFSDLDCCASGSPRFLQQRVVNAKTGRLVLNPNPDLIPRGLLNDHFDPFALPSRYEAQIHLPAGEQYELRVVLSDGAKFGRAVTPLSIDSWDGKQLAISSIALCKRFRDAGAAAQEAAAANLAPQYVPLVSRGVQVTPAADTRFNRGEHLIAYFEVYEPLLSQQPGTQVQAHMRIVDAKNGQIKEEYRPMDAAPYRRPGSTMIPIGDELIVSQLPKGDYRLEVQATDSAGRSTPWRTASFTLE
jgi:hypothetical protein